MVIVKRYGPGRFWDPLRRFAIEIGLPLEAIAREPVALAPEKPRYYEVYDAPRLPLPGDVRVIPGDFLGILVPARAFKPSLPLAARLAGKCGVIKCHRVTADGERFFLYGRGVLEDNIIEWHPGVGVVVNELGEPLGWGIGRIVKRGAKRERLVAPLWDLGWYLRRGG